jgi:predicted RecB family nuclease
MIKIKRLDNDTSGRRFYQASDKDKVIFTYPSVTTILDETVPKDAFLIKWIREQGIGGQAIFEKAAEEGTEAHVAIEELLNGGVVPTEDMSPKVKKCVQAFIDWHELHKPETLETEQIVYNMEGRYAGGCDYVCKIGDQTYVIDWKTSNSIQDKHLYQVAAYRMALDTKYPDAKTAIVHLGNRNKCGFTFKEFDWKEAYKFFEHYNTTFKMNNPDVKPNIKTYPQLFKLNTNENNSK